MSEKTIETQQTPPITGPSQVPVKPKKKVNKKKRIKNIITLIVVAAVIVAAVFLLKKYVFSDPEEEKGDAILDTACISSISTSVEGNGSALAANSKTITLTAAGTVTGVYVTEGQQVKAGDALYTITSPAAEETASKAKEAVTAAEKGVVTAQEGVTSAQNGVVDAQDALADCKTALTKRNNELAKIYTEQATAETDRTITAAFSGQIRDAVTYQIGDEVAKGTQIAKLVDDSKFRLSLYFNYAYEGQIYVGQSAAVSIPSYMSNLNGTVETINMVNRVSAEGSKLFEVVVVFDNPGALTDGLKATAVLGGSIYPYDSGTTAYYRTVAVLTKTDGKVESVNLTNYTNVTAGQKLLVLSAVDYTDQITAKKEEIVAAEKAVTKAESAITDAQKAIVTAQQGVEDAQKAVTEAQTAADKAVAALDDFNAVAPIDGTVLSCSLVAGQAVESGRVAISIADTTSMKVTINVDERNVGYLYTGMMIELKDWNENQFIGTVDTVSLEGKSENNITTFPVTVQVDNSDGTLLTGTTLYYSFVANQSDGCIVLPINDVRSMTTAEGETIKVVYVQKDSRPDNAVDLTGESANDCPDGFYAVPVSIGISDNYNVEITEGVQEGDVVFNSYASTEEDSGVMYYG